MIRLIDLPYADQLHSRLTMLPHLVPTNDERSRDLFAGVVSALGFKLEPWGSADLTGFLTREEPIDVTDYADLAPGEEVKFWRERGWDILANDGERVAFFDLIFNLMVIVEEGRGGHSKVGLEAKLWAQSRQSRREQPRKQDKDFLSLGKPARKRRLTG